MEPSVAKMGPYISIAILESAITLQPIEDEEVTLDERYEIRTVRDETRPNRT